MKKYYLLPVIVAVFLFLLATAVNAQGLQLGVKQGLFDVELYPGQSFEGTVGVINTSHEQPMPVTANLALWNLKQDSDDIEYVTANEALNATKWFSLPTKNFIIDVDRFKDLPVKITAPKSAAPGTYLVALRLSVSAPDYLFANDGPRFLPELDVLFFIKIRDLSLTNEANNYKASILSVEPKSSNQISAFAPIANAGVFEDVVKTFLAKIRNDGIYYFKADGQVQISNIFGRVVKTIPLPKRYLLPGRTRSIEIGQINPDEHVGFFTSVFRYVADHLYIGKYTATVVLNYPESASSTIGIVQGAFASQSVDFWVFPWKFTILVIIIGYFIWLLIRHRRRFVDAFKALRSGRA